MENIEKNLEDYLKGYSQYKLDEKKLVDSEILEKSESYEIKSSNRFLTIISQFKKIFDGYDKVLPYLHLDENTKLSLEKKRDWIHRLEQEDFPVAFLGSFSAGKSTIINGILDRDLLPEKIQSTTAFPTIIRKGSKDLVVIYYIDENAKVSLWNQLCNEIGIKIDKNLNKESDLEDISEHLKRIKEMVSEYEKVNNQIDSKPLKTLENLFTGWHNDKYKILKKSIELSELKNYVEGHEDSLFIDRIEVNLEKLEVPENIVLVDLPGLNVANQRHIQFTKEYIQEKAKAFVVCMKPFQLLEGQEIIFLEETNRTNPTILQRSFWVINQWDRLNQNQKIEEEGNFFQKIQQYNLTITRERFFKTSALNYLLLACIANETINQTDKLKSEISNLDLIKITQTNADKISSEEAKKLLEHQEIKAFSYFRYALLDYLDNQAKDEFLTNAKSELLQVIVILKKHLEVFDDWYKDDNDRTREIHTIEVTRQSDIFVKCLKQKIQEFSFHVRDSLKIDFWNNEHTIEVEKEINRRISQLNKEELKDKLQSGDYIKVFYDRFLPIVEETIKIHVILKEKLVFAIEAFFVQRLNKLLLELKDVNKDYLPERILNNLENLLSKRDIEMRLNGLVDYLFFNYNDELNRISKNLRQSQDISLEKIVIDGLEEYKNILINFISNLKEDINKYVKFSVKNHTEYLERELLGLLEEEKEHIIFQISQKVNTSEAIKFEQNKSDIIKDTYSTIKSISNEL
ncbi:dynamin family protein [Nostoc favosum]|uniref:Dynamin family protein n=1 Tax=Nostoc favosum CHAB5714 TaxID=2780399 RepID=A0ABS8I7C8_9NOSO|nr:dynamin family protein [Nostoc favosum]MCC5599437.1 dynamin family protein [Nostoc favosum CHAB5714]